jgi:hypothetical protein
VVTDADQALTMARGAQAGFRIVPPVLPEGDGCGELIVGDHDGRRIPLLEQGAEGPCRQGILQGIRAFPTAAHNRHRSRAFLQKSLGHGFAVRQSRGDQQGNIADAIQRPRAVGGAHEQTLASHRLGQHGHRRIAEIETRQCLPSTLSHPQS